jgi:hypothetical protein
VTPELRIRAVNAAPLRSRGTHVVYWMTAARRLCYNFGLQRAAELARERRVPLVVLEALRAGYPWASVRLHRFVIDGMKGHAASPHVYPYLETEPGAGRGLLEALASTAATRTPAAGSSGASAATTAPERPVFGTVRYMSSASASRKLRLEGYLSRHA